jgi:prephenate dehydrogenase
MFESLTVVGVGLISGSFSLALKEKGMVRRVIGVSRTEESIRKALDLGLIDTTMPIEDAVRNSDLIYVAIPVDVTIPMITKIMGWINENRLLQMQAQQNLRSAKPWPVIL